MPRPALSATERDQMRRRLADAALALYLEQGFEAVSLRALADALGISHTLPYRYFENKEAVFAHMRRDAVLRLEAFVRRRERAHEAPLDAIRTLFDAYVAYARAHPAEYLLIFSSQQPPPDRYPALLQARQRFFDHALERVQACIADDSMGGDARRVAHAFWVGLHGLISLHVANQLVHGCTLGELAPALLEMLIKAAAPPRAAARRGGPA